MAKVTIITPTLGRQALLPALWQCVQSQTHSDIEWLISDGSPFPSAAMMKIEDPRVRYLHYPQPMSIGARRNGLCDIATGEVIVHFDDDDHYAAHYIAHMLAVMAAQQADFAKLFGFYIYARVADAFGYYDLEYDLAQHHVVQPNSKEVRIGNYVSPPDVEWGFGFSYVYKRQVWEKAPFPDRNHGEDLDFIGAARAAFKVVGVQDERALALHVIHRNNSTIVFPQKILRNNKRRELFPSFV